MPEESGGIWNKIHEELSLEQKKHQAYLQKYPQNIPNDVCKHAFIRGFSIENSFNPKVGEYNFLFRTDFEDVYIWTYKENKKSALVSNVNLTVKELPHWKTAAHLIELSLLFAESFEFCLIDTYYTDYKWMFYFDPKRCHIDDIVFANLSEGEVNSMSYGRELKATEIANLAAMMELIFRDDKAYTAISLMTSAFQAHSCCLTCELSDHPYHDHLAEEPPIWQQANELQNMEICIVQSCRTVECLLGEPPNQRSLGKVYQHKEQWLARVGIDPDAHFKKANTTYLQFYYDLFFKLRNPSAHSYGNIHYDLARKLAIDAQCFATSILRGYIQKCTISNDDAMNRFSFNREFLSRVSENMSTPLTDFAP